MRVWFTMALLLTACESMPASGDPLAPRAVDSNEVEQADLPPDASGEAPVAQPDGFDFEGDAAPEPTLDDGLPDDPAALLALQQGMVVPPPDAELAIPAEPEPVGVETVPAAVAEPPETYGWDPDVDPPSSFGVRLLSTLNRTNPPKAIVGLPDGTEQVVQAGTMLPEQQLVVMAVGHQVVEVARIEPSGYQAKITTQRLEALFAE